jgi:hypothetical protein
MVTALDCQPRGPVPTGLEGLSRAAGRRDLTLSPEDAITSIRTPIE